MSGKSDLRHEVMGVGTGLSGYVSESSAPRIYMFSTHQGQHLIPEGIGPNSYVVGVEDQYADATNKIEAPCSGRIEAIIEKYTHKIPGTNRKELNNNGTLVIISDMESNIPTLRSLILESHRSDHTTFGYKYKVMNQELLKVGGYIRKGTIFRQSPGVNKDGTYMYGIPTKVVFGSFPGVTEDGVIISESYAKRLATTVIGHREISWGYKQFPLNLYGDDTVYKPFPDVGDYVRADGLLFATRDYDPVLTPVNMNRKTTKDYCPYTDNPVYIDGIVSNKEGTVARIIDVTVYRSNRSESPTPKGMSQQTQLYNDIQKDFNSKLMDVYNKFKKKYPNGTVDKDLHRLIVQAQAYNSEDSRVTNLYGAEPIDDWKVNITYEIIVDGRVGFKLTGTHGDKGVACVVMPDDYLPIDQHGTRADMAADDSSTIKRMNIGRVSEHYVNGTTDRVLDEVLSLYQDGDIDGAYDYLMRYYACSSETDSLATKTISTQEDKINHLEHIRKHGATLYLPPGRDKVGSVLIESLTTNFPMEQHIGPVTYRDQDGKEHTTIEDILIADMYIMSLEKVGHTWASLSTSARGHFGLPSKLNKRDRNSKPFRDQSVKFFSESEGRLYASNVGPEYAAQLLEEPNSPQIQRDIGLSILTADEPTNIDEVYDREKYSEHTSRAVQFCNSLLYCSGVVLDKGDNN